MCESDVIAPEECDCDLGAGLAPQHAGDLVQSHALGGFIPHLDDIVACMDSKPVCRGILDRSNYPHIWKVLLIETGITIVLAYIKAHATELAGGGVGKRVHLLFIHKDRIGVAKALEHSLHSSLEQGLLVHIFHIIALDEPHHLVKYNAVLAGLAAVLRKGERNKSQEKD